MNNKRILFGQQGEYIYKERLFCVHIINKKKKETEILDSVVEMWVKERIWKICAASLFRGEWKRVFILYLSWRRSVSFFFFY